MLWKFETHRGVWYNLALARDLLYASAETMMVTMRSLWQLSMARIIAPFLLHSRSFSTGTTVQRVCVAVKTYTQRNFGVLLSLESVALNVSARAQHQYTLIICCDADMKYIGHRKGQSRETVIEKQLHGRERAHTSYRPVKRDSTA
eukprot:6186376-Pleurochrysis_carterae.AAC.10